ncbi:hypothetical protein AYI68_g3960 [Smittium mucronatum]|uniref:Uncharacterized protein n=1 Tax=Smittium mucronatum TaxID=133383 RepID=A0A1R0GYG5_9FUNG|nr:hypothetical protein AYI68_g3960 [Smittium mucronatum]
MVYKKLSEALNLNEEYFFQTPLTEEDQNTALIACQRTISMNYIPPPLNDSASSSVNNLDTTLHKIQTMLAQVIRPIDYELHRKIQDNQGIITTEYPDISFANTMWVLLFDIAASVTQSRIDNLHNRMELLRRVKRIFDTEKNLLTGQDAFDALLAKKKTETRKSSTEVTPAAGKEISYEGSIGAAEKAHHRGNDAIAEESISLQYEIMDFDDNNNEARKPEPGILERQTEVMERSLFFARDTRIGYLYVFQRSGLGDSSGFSILLKTVDPLGSGDAHQSQVFEDSILSIVAKVHDGPSSSDLLGQ